MLSTSLVFFTATVATRYGLGIGEEAGEQGSSTSLREAALSERGEVAVSFSPLPLYE
ncbi:hypothetical protein [Nostoc sp.]|uniref:hypothetical protein n=1 Tax=Nostoc sp. TaxID=1180 RepID=UPI002FFA215B